MKSLQTETKGAQRGLKGSVAPDIAVQPLVKEGYQSHDISPVIKDAQQIREWKLTPNPRLYI